MAPINLPDGSQVSEIVLPDGSTASEVLAPDGSTVFSAIPDSDVYLHDDWGDNKLQNRDESGTTTYNGVEGVYRPEWNIALNEPSVSNQRLTVVGGDGITTDINLDLSQTITWELSGIDVSNNGGSNDDVVNYHLFAEQASTFDGSNRLHSAYTVQIRTSGTNVFIIENDGDGNTSTLVGGSDISGSDNTITVTRQSDGTWELIQNDASQGTAVDNSHTNPATAAFTGAAGANVSFNEVKVS